MPARVRPGTGNATWVLMLAMALWLASTLGFMHRVVHAPGARALVATVAVAGVIATDPAATGPKTGAAAHAHVRVGWATLFGHQGGTDDCRLYDQLGGTCAIPSLPLVVLPIAMPMARFHYFLGEAVARWVTLFDARGPPLTR